MMHFIEKLRRKRFERKFEYLVLMGSLEALKA